MFSQSLRAPGAPRPDRSEKSFFGLPDLSGLASTVDGTDRRYGALCLKPALACLAIAAALLPLGAARAEIPDPIGDLIGEVAAKVEPLFKTFGLKATLYHLGLRGIRNRDSLGCKVVPMRTAAVDGVDVPRHSLLFIKETVGLPMPDGRSHDGYWYASDIGGAIHKGRIDLFTGDGSKSMQPMLHLNLATLTVAKVGEFEGCPTS
jgi:3D (Asp-Asp-Asp) domain-containing protein